MTIIFLKENYEGLSNCNFVVSDADGWIDDVVTKLTANVSSRLLFQRIKFNLS